MYSPDGTIIYGSRGGEFDRIGWCRGGAKSSKTEFLEGHFLLTCSDISAVGCIV